MKKYIPFLLLTLFLLVQTISNAQEGTKIPFKKGVLKICSSKNFVIKGYDGDEVLIKNLHTIKSGRIINLENRKISQIGNLQGTLKKNILSIDSVRSVNNLVSKINDSILYGFLRSSIGHKDRSIGLKKLGKKAIAEENGIYLKIEQKGNELIIKDDYDNSFVMFNNESYEITIPNSIKLRWNPRECNTNLAHFSHSKPSELKNFNGEVEISSSLNNFNLTDVSGPVSINTLGGNVTIVFDKTTPNKLYSIYSNNGFIDISLPKTSNVLVDAKASEILSDLDFSIVSEENKIQSQHMNLKLGTGKVKMKLDADLGKIYLRKQ